MDLILKNYSINTPILDILKRVKSELSNGKLKTLDLKHDNIMVTCPHHKNGLEDKPSCGVYCGEDPTIEKGKCHCFTCGFSGPLTHFIGECFDRNDSFGEKWLIDHFGVESNLSKQLNLQPIELPARGRPKKFLQESILDKFQSYHPYMAKRKLTKEIIEKFKIKYDPISKCIIFPVWDEHNLLVMLTKRNIENKCFYIDKNIEKPVYLLNYLINDNSKIAYVCESQINTLTLQGYGLPAIGLIGCSLTKKQKESLLKSGITTYYLALDGDPAGWKGIKKFIDEMGNNVIINIIEMPKNQDVNDLTQKEFKNLPILDKWEWLNKYNSVL